MKDGYKRANWGKQLNVYSRLKEKATIRQKSTNKGRNVQRQLEDLLLKLPPKDKRHIEYYEWELNM